MFHLYKMVCVCGIYIHICIGIAIFLDTGTAIGIMRI